jgi:hypothetical protein
VDLHPRPGDRWTWRFTTPDPLRRARPGWRLTVLSPSAPERAMPLTPLSRPSLRAALSHERFGSGCQGRASRPSVKIERVLRPRVPFIDRGHPRSCANRRRSRVRSRERFRFDPALGALSPRAPRATLLALTRSYSELGPRPRTPLAPRVKGCDGRFMEPDCRLSTSATTFTTRGHTPGRPVLTYPLKAVNVPLPSRVALTCSALV